MDLEMIKIAEGTEFPVDVRQLHVWLGVGEKFTTWIEKRILECGFDSEIDYISFSEKPANSVGRPRLDYYISFDMAKELAMLEKNDKGRQARKYFIEAEKKLREVSRPKEIQQPKSSLDILMAQYEMVGLMLQNQVELANQVQRNTEQNAIADSRISALEARSDINDNYVTISGFLSLKKIKGKTREEIKILGMQVAKYCKENGIKIAKVSNPQYGQINAYPKSVLEELI